MKSSIRKSLALSAATFFTFSPCCHTSANADALLDTTLKKAAAHDFIKYFEFAETNVVPNPNIGLSEHSYYSKSWTCTLTISVDRANRVVHMKLGVPRPLIDDEKVTTRGRDIVKSFVLASAIDEDVAPLKHLADEIYVRGLDLQPIKLDTKNGAKAPQSAHMQAFKVGKGPLSNGDNAIFLESLPKLTPKPSEPFEAFSGKRPRAEDVLQNCRLSFANEIMPGSNSMKVLWIHSWDENFWKSLFGAAQRGKK
jgi:hypothetical protein